MPLSAEDAFDLSKQFRDLGINLGNYRFANWTTLTPSQRRDLEDEEWSLLNASSDMTTKAVGLTLEESRDQCATHYQFGRQGQTSHQKIRKGE